MSAKLRSASSYGDAADALALATRGERQDAQPQFGRYCHVIERSGLRIGIEPKLKRQRWRFAIGLLRVTIVQ